MVEGRLLTQVIAQKAGNSHRHAILNVIIFQHIITSLLPLHALEDQTSHDSSSNRQAAHNSHAHQSFLGDLIIDQAAQTLCLQIPILEV